MDVSEHEVGLCLGPTEPSSSSSGMLAVYICVEVCGCENLSLLSAQWFQSLRHSHRHHPRGILCLLLAWEPTSLKQRACVQESKVSCLTEVDSRWPRTREEFLPEVEKCISLHGMELNSLTVSLFSFFLCFHWNIIALQCHVSSCCTTKWTSYLYTYIPSLMSPLLHVSFFLKTYVSLF